MDEQLQSSVTWFLINTENKALYSCLTPLVQRIPTNNCEILRVNIYRQKLDPLLSKCDVHSVHVLSIVIIYVTADEAVAYMF